MLTVGQPEVELGEPESVPEKGTLASHSAAPAPLNTTLISDRSFPTSSTAFNKAAPEMIAVPC
jgi:hypothetical protein